jgi:hypothetical protein
MTKREIATSLIDKRVEVIHSSTYTKPITGLWGTIVCVYIQDDEPKVTVKLDNDGLLYELWTSMVRVL